MVSDKPTLVLLHGWGVNQGVWQGIATHFGDTVKVLTPDLPGFGLCQQYPAPYQLDAVVDMLAHNIPEQSYICGWSLGGLLAIALASRQPEKVRELAIIAASPCFVARQNWPGMAETVLQQFADALNDNVGLTLDRFLAIQAMGSHSARADIKQLKQAIMAYPTASTEAISGALQLLKTDLRPEFAALRQPVSGLYGRLDALVPVNVVEQLQQLQPAARFTVSASASHAPFISHSAEFCLWLNEWLNLPDNQSGRRKIN